MDGAANRKIIVSRSWMLNTMAKGLLLDGEMQSFDIFKQKCKVIRHIKNRKLWCFFHITWPRIENKTILNWTQLQCHIQHTKKCQASCIEIWIQQKDLVYISLIRLEGVNFLTACVRSLMKSAYFTWCCCFARRLS